MLQFIEEAFEENYELLRLEGGHSLSPHVKKLALEQVKNYWKKLRDVAENVSDTEVRLTLPERETPAGRRYTIQGVVDVVKEDNRTRSEEHTSELQSRGHLVCRLLLEKKKK